MGVGRGKGTGVGTIETLGGAVVVVGDGLGSEVSMTVSSTYAGLVRSSISGLESPLTANAEYASRYPRPDRSIPNAELSAVSALEYSLYEASSETATAMSVPSDRPST